MTSTTASTFRISQWRRAATVAVAGCAVLAACGGAGATDKTGGTQRETLSLRLAAVENERVPYAAHIKEFARAVDAASGGSVTIDIQWDAGNPFDGRSEQRVADLARSGDVDLAVVPSRAWDLEGVKSMEALQVPLLVDDWDLLGAIARAPVAAEMMGGLTSIGVEPLAMWPESLRHPVGFQQPLTSPDDLRGLGLRSPASRVTGLLATTLGYVAVPPSGEATPYDGAESGFVWGFDLPRFGTFTGNVALGAKANILVANGASFDRLSDATRKLLDQAAQDTIDFVIRTSEPEQQLALDYCTLGGAVALATDAQLSAWRDTTAPVVADIEADATSKHVVDEITAMKQSAPADVDRQAVACEHQSATPSNSQSAALTFPDGVYRTDSPVDGIVTFSMHGGTWQRITADGRLDCEATYVVTDDRIVLTFTSDASLSCGDPAGSKLLDATWTLVGDQLRFTDIHSDPGATQEFSLPWTKIE